LHSNSLKNPKANGVPVVQHQYERDLLKPLFYFSFAEIFYVDATSEDTIQTDLEAIAPGNSKRTVDASLRWLASQADGTWLLIFDNADNVDLKLKKYFPSCPSGNILITTRNRELRHYTAEDADADVKDMDLEDAKALLLVQARAKRSDDNIALTETIVKVVILLPYSTEGSVLTHPEGTPLLCIGRHPSRCLHSLPLVLEPIPRTLPT